MTKNVNISSRRIRIYGFTNGLVHYSCTHKEPDNGKSVPEMLAFFVFRAA